MSATAWLLTLNDGVRVALGSHWIREVIGEHERASYSTFTVPLMPNYCHQLMHWRNLLIPVLQLEGLVGKTPPALARYHVVVAISPLEGDKNLHYGVIVCSALPMQVTLQDNELVDYPQPVWADYACSCFIYQEDAVPILDTTKIFNIFAN